MELSPDHVNIVPKLNFGKFKELKSLVNGVQRLFKKTCLHFVLGLQEVVRAHFCVCFRSKQLHQQRCRLFDIVKSLFKIICLLGRNLLLVEQRNLVLNFLLPLFWRLILGLHLVLHGKLLGFK